jgi:hypothetical protein
VGWWLGGVSRKAKLSSARGLGDGWAVGLRLFGVGELGGGRGNRYCERGFEGIGWGGFVMMEDGLWG